MKNRAKQAYMKAAETFAELSYAVRLKVGAIVVKDDRIISIGYNGMPAGWDNVCEHVVGRSGGKPVLKTKADVLHAESNAITKLARSSESGEGATMFITHAPCIDCAKLIYQSGIDTVYYKNDYRSTQGLEFLKECNIPVEQIDV